MGTSEEFFILVYRKCEVCHGTSEIEHPLWASFQNWIGDRDVTQVSRPERDEWWHEHGYPRGEPNEKLRCVRCQNGMVPAYIPLKEAFGRVLADLKFEILNAPSAVANRTGKPQQKSPLEAVDRKP
jgi:hypothetical protein